MATDVGRSRTSGAPWLCLTLKAGTGLSADEVAAQLSNTSSGALDARASVLSSLDGRESRRVHGTPGGDMGEVLLALSVIDDMTGGAYLTTEHRVLSVIEAVSRMKGALYMCTDARAVERLEGALVDRGFKMDESDAHPPDMDDDLIDALVLPEHVGCRHLRSILENPAAYGVRVHLCRWAITSFLRLLWTPAHSHRMQLVIHMGDAAERAVVIVQTEHLVAPCFDVQTVVLHPAVVQLERERLANWLSTLLARDPASAPFGVEAAPLLAAVNARGRTQLELALDAIGGGLPVISARTDGSMVMLFAAPTSSSSLGPLMLARECRVLRDLTPVALSDGEHRSSSFREMNPFAKVPTLRSADGVSLGESAAILRFLATRYGPRHLYPAGVDPAHCARIDFAIDSFSNEGCLHGHTAVVSPLLGFAAKPDDQHAANGRYARALEQWAASFLSGTRFVGGEQPTIADFKVAPFFYAAAHSAVAELAGFACPARISQFAADFAAHVPSAAFLVAHSSGRAIGEMLAAALRAAPPTAAPPTAASGTAARNANAKSDVASAAAPAGLPLGSVVPDFVAESTHGRIRFHEYIAGSWSALFSHPDDFAPVGTTELGSLAQLQPQFRRRGVKVIALACSDISSHERWCVDVLAVAKVQNDRGFPYPILADASRQIATQLGMIEPITCRAVFVFAPDMTLKLSLMYPVSCGLNFGELLRAIDSLQMTAQYKVATPANWIPGKSVMVLPSVSDDEARANLPKGFAHQPVPSGRRYMRVTPDPTV